MYQTMLSWLQTTDSPKQMNVDDGSYKLDGMKWNIKSKEYKYDVGVICYNL